MKSWVNAKYDSQNEGKEWKKKKKKKLLVAVLLIL